jgi:V/A-type H+-transporting ATPase subunit I
VFKSEKLVRITIQVPEQFISAVTGTLAGFKLLHLIRIDETHLGHLGYAAEADDGLLNEFDELFKTVEALLVGLQIPLEAETLEESVIPEKEIFRAREHLSAIKSESESVLGDLAAIEQKLRDDKTLVERFKLLPGDLDLSRLSDRHYVRWAVGLLPVQGLEKLEESLSQVHHAFIEMGTLQERAVILVFGLKKDWQVFEGALKGALFDPIEVSGRVSGTITEMIANIESCIGDLEAKEQRLAAQKELFQGKFGAELLMLRERIILARQVLNARRFFGKIDKSYLITGWIPDRLFPDLEEALKRITDGQVIMESVDPEDIREVREGIVKIPILFNNPMLISPFEKLTSLYGTPRYREVEPTVFFALTFLLMFGMMFGDVGQGGVLFLLGYLIFRRFYKYIDYGIILMETGVSATLFGFLYGTVFGLENLIPPLWIRPVDNIPYLIKVTLSFGIGLVSLGLILNLVNALRLKEYETLLSASGLGGALFYWIFAGLFVKYLLLGRVAPSELKFLGWAAAGLTTIMILHRPLYRMIFKKEHPSHVLRRAGFWTELLEAIVELLDDLIRFLANTVSFIRMAAFALAHAALFVAVFSIADVVAHEKGTGIFYWLVVAVGNVIIILLEGLVVSIQTVRLEYYEFFSKFFRGGGEPFKPFDKDIGSQGKSS